MEHKFTTELIEKAKECKSAEELLALAKENNIILTAEEAIKYFEKLNSENNELADDKLDAIAGGFAREALDSSSIQRFH